MMNKAININGMVISFERLENDKKQGKVFVWVDKYIIMQFTLEEYKVKYKFKGDYSGTYFFELIKR